MAFRGHYEQRLDAKNRLSVPSGFRASFADGMVLLGWLDPCISIWTPDALDDYADRVLGAVNPITPTARTLTAFFAGGAFDARLDSAGRVTLNQSLLDHAEIDKDVIVVGMRDHVEVWDRERWADRQRGAISEVERIAKSLEHPS